MSFMRLMFYDNKTIMLWFTTKLWFNDLSHIAKDKIIEKINDIR